MVHYTHVEENTMTHDQLQSQPVRRPLDDEGSFFVHAPADVEISDELSTALDEFRSAVIDLRKTSLRRRNTASAS